MTRLLDVFVTNQRYLVVLERIEIQTSRRLRLNTGQIERNYVYVRVRGSDVRLFQAKCSKCQQVIQLLLAMRHVVTS